MSLILNANRVVNPHDEVQLDPTVQRVRPHMRVQNANVVDWGKHKGSGWLQTLSGKVQIGDRV